MPNIIVPSGVRIGLRIERIERTPIMQRIVAREVMRAVARWYYST